MNTPNIKRVTMIIILLIMLVGHYVYGKPELITLGSIEYKVYNDVLKEFQLREAELSYDTSTSNNIIRFSFEDYLTTYDYSLYSKDIITLTTAIDKYFKWEKTATDDEDQIGKRIITLDNIGASFYQVDEWHYTVDKNTIDIYFFSQNIHRHQLVLGFSKLLDMHNEYIDTKAEFIYLDKSSIISLVEIISKENIKKKMDEAVAQEKTESKYQ